MMITRAFENGVYLAPCNKVGLEGEWTFGGRSMVVSPRGEILAQAGSEGDQTLLVKLDRAEVDAARRRYPMLRDRRPETYAPLSVPDELARQLPG
jgi:predicted amidohydrolase